MSEIRCNKGWAKRTYRTASCVIDGVCYSIEARQVTEDADELVTEDEWEVYHDCRLTEDGIVAMEGKALFEYGEEIGETPADEPVQYLQKWLRENVDEDITLVV